MMDFPNSLDDFDGVAAFVVLLGASRGGSLGAPAHSAGNGDNILQETGVDFILQENGDYILQEGP